MILLIPFRWRRERDEDAASKAARLLRAKGVEQQRARVIAKANEIRRGYGLPEISL